MNSKTKNMEMTFLDEYTVARSDEAVVKHLDLDIKVNFERKIISGKATYQIENKKGVDIIYFDTRNMNIEKVTLGEDEEDTKFALGYYVEVLGKPLEINIKPNTRKVNIYYSTHPKAIALQWLAPQQTEGKKHPYLFTQSEPCYARSWIPSQDSPGIRFTYNAKVQVPPGLMAIMSAGNPQQKNEDGIYTFEMKQPIPTYLLALAVGDFVFKPVGKRTGVYAESSLIDKAIYEFGELEDMLITVEELYGAYRWDRYDVIVLPPSFPFGGMENPRITFLTPTVLAGDRSLVSLIAHELAHSWSGNLVTNATWNDFWINEGFTVYLEKRIMEELYGRPYVNMLSLLGYQDLKKTIERMGADNPDTHLKLELNGRDPDNAMTDIPYEKGSLFLQMIEETVGRERWDAFLKKYFDNFAFQSMSSDRFVEYLKDELIGNDKALAEKIAIDEWVFGSGLPGNCPVVKSNRFELVDQAVKNWTDGSSATELNTKEWTTHEWLHFLRHLPSETSTEKMGELDKAFNFTHSGNSEILAAWFIHVINNKYTDAYNVLEKFLITVGRRKFLRPIYKEMAKTEEGKIMAINIYGKARPNYHSVSTGTIDGILGWDEDGRVLAKE
ncbi:M1 family metallopeptidase [bacterium AH-315-M05]|nr:M1 family metallopeptidase [bacterium AH-315-M05]